MDSPVNAILITIALILGNAFFVATEYALVSTRRTKVEALARQGSVKAVGLLRVLDNVSHSVAACQIGITLMSLALGSVSEPSLSHLMQRLVGDQIDPRISFVLAFTLVIFGLVVFGELVPKYFALDKAENLALTVYRPLSWFTAICTPVIWLAQKAAGLVLKPFGMEVPEERDDSLSREELDLLVRDVQDEGILDKVHGEFVTRALRMDALVAKDLMIHRLDIKWLDASKPKQVAMAQLKTIPHNRIPLCNGDIDELIGIVYLQDVVKNLPASNLDFRAIARQPVVVPENLTIDRVVTTMRESKSQILIVSDEYGGISGLLTLEDVVEEIFGELDDRLEGDRPPIERFRNRLVARSEVRYDEVVRFLELDDPTEPNTDTLANMIVENLGRIPKLGDRIETPLGILRVDNMARRRITRVSILLNDKVMTEKGS